MALLDLFVVNVAIHDIGVGLHYQSSLSDVAWVLNGMPGEPQHQKRARAMNTAIYQDLSYLNRDLTNVILLDTDPEHCLTHPENSIVIPKWKGTPGDTGLVAMIPFLECGFLIDRSRMRCS